ncbi:hypothetical protein DPEC_G00163960 [Dallia pectoralis]|uniref:Uncharacterized protein n=1 Tax=Dallia pectoralis TaxID=75939 RepID=A0ACC2GHG8_DALPE|nr:hypothetical protein DPEC_G00163960 [Dallia pectoralis]
MTVTYTEPGPHLTPTLSSNLKAFEAVMPHLSSESRDALHLSITEISCRLKGDRRMSRLMCRAMEEAGEDRNTQGYVMESRTLSVAHSVCL